MLSIVREPLPGTSCCLHAACALRYRLAPACGLASCLSVLEE